LNIRLPGNCLVPLTALAIACVVTGASAPPAAAADPWYFVRHSPEACVRSPSGQSYKVLDCGNLVTLRSTIDRATLCFRGWRDHTYIVTAFSPHADALQVCLYVYGSPLLPTRPAPPGQPAAATVHLTHTGEVKSLRILAEFIRIRGAKEPIEFQILDSGPHQRPVPSDLSYNRADWKGLPPVDFNADSPYGRDGDNLTRAPILQAPWVTTVRTAPLIMEESSWVAFTPVGRESHQIHGTEICRRTFEVVRGHEYRVQAFNPDAGRGGQDTVGLFATYVNQCGVLAECLHEPLDGGWVYIRFIAPRSGTCVVTASHVAHPGSASPRMTALVVQEVTPEQLRRGLAADEGKARPPLGRWD
jgi:hypothetical protein